MKKRKHVARKEKQQSKPAKASTSRDVRKVDNESPISVPAFKPIEIRGEPLSTTILRERRWNPSTHGPILRCHTSRGLHWELVRFDRFGM